MSTINGGSKTGFYLLAFVFGLFLITVPGKASTATDSGANLSDSRYYAVIDNADDVATIYINSKMAVQAKWGHGEGGEPIGHRPGRTGWVDITPFLSNGGNSIRFTVENTECCLVTARFMIYKGKGMILQENFALDNCSSLGVIHDVTKSLDAQSAVINPVPPAKSDRYYAEITNVDDVATIYLNSRKVLEASWGKGEGGVNIGHMPGHSGRVDMTPFLKPGKNIFRFTVWNEQICCGVSGTFRIFRGDDLVIEEYFSNQDSTSGIKFDKQRELNIADPKLPDQAIEIALRTQIGRDLERYILYLRDNHKIVMVDGPLDKRGEAFGYFNRNRLIWEGSEALYCRWEEERIELNQNFPVEIVASTLIHEATHFRDLSKTSKEGGARLNIGDAELRAHANQYLFFQQAGLLQSNAFLMMDGDALIRSYNYVYRKGNRKKAVDALIKKGYSRETLNADINIVCVSDF